MHHQYDYSGIYDAHGSFAINLAIARRVPLEVFNQMRKFLDKRQWRLMSGASFDDTNNSMDDDYPETCFNNNERLDKILDTYPDAAHIPLPDC